jgi:putative ABC transport system permease protein
MADTGGHIFESLFSRWRSIIILILVLGLIIIPNARNLSYNVWFGSVATGLCFAFVAIGVYLTFRVLNFPDLTIDGSFPLGAALSASLIVNGLNPALSIIVAFIGGAIAGMTTALITTRLKIHSLLSSILTTTALISVNLRILVQSNIPILHQESIFTVFSEKVKAIIETFDIIWMQRVSTNLSIILFVGLVVLLFKLFFDWVMLTEFGLGMQATGDNPQMIRALGMNTDRMLVIGVAFSNGLVGISGAIFAQYQGFADVNMGVGLIIAGLAAVIIGETIFHNRGKVKETTSVILGMIIYRIAIAAALNIKIPIPGGDFFRVNAHDVKLATALLVLGALWYSYHQKQKKIRNHVTN